MNKRRFALSALLICAVWQAAAAPDAWPGAALAPYGETLDLETAETYVLGFAYEGQPDERLPYGADALSDPDSMASATPGRREGSGVACFMHTPYRGGHGVTFQEFEVALPEADRIALRGATALRTGADESDGVTFRVLIDGKALFGEHRKSFVPESFAADLTPYAGKTVRVRFEVHPGPKNNTNFDWANWSDRRIEIPGYKETPEAMPAPPGVDLARLSSRQNGSWVPLSGFEGQRNVRETQDGYIFEYEGADGTLAYRWRPPAKADDPPLGQWSLTAALRGGTPVLLPLVTGASMTWDDDARPVAWKGGLENESPVVEIRFEGSGGAAVLRVMPKLIEKSLVLDVECDAPLISRFYPGKWGPSARRVQVPVPYYGHDIDYLPRENLFVSRFLDFSESNAGNLINDNANYPERIGGGRNALKERAIFTAAWHLAETFANIPNPVSPWRGELGERIVLDIWGGRYSDIAATLDMYSSLGLDGIAVIIHNWQYHGYDNGLPTHYPANARYGGDEAMRGLARTARGAGYFFALHENYVDYYPNYEDFDESQIALNPDGERIKAWFNGGTGIQSFAVRPSAMLDLAKTQSPVIHENYDTNAMFHDVASCVEPWFHVDHRADGPDAATMRPTVAAHRDLCAYERETHEGPVLGEGNRHWLWSGWLDGVEAQFGTGWPNNRGLTAPLNAGFNLLRVHPLELNHGQGYFSRWYDEAPWGNVMPPVLLDKYRMQEMVFGHAGFLNQNWGRQHEAWLEHELTIPVTRRHASAKLAALEYNIGGAWVDLTAAAKAQDFRRVRVRYDSGLTITANDTDESWQVDEWKLPAYGWVAEAEDFAAGTVVMDGDVVDFVRSPGHYFANARPARVWQPEAAPAPILPTVAAFAQRGPRQFDVTYAWEAEEPLDFDAAAFVHFRELARHANRPAAIRFQADHKPDLPASQWKAGARNLDGPWTVTLPEDLPDGRYLWETGLLSQGGRGERLRLDGFHDGDEQIRLGYLAVSGGGKSLRFEQNGELPPRSYWLAQHMNLKNRVIDFGIVRTDGSVRLARNGGGWTLRVLPMDGGTTVQVKASEIPMPAHVMADGGSMVKPRMEGEYWTLLTGDGKKYTW